MGLMLDTAILVFKYAGILLAGCFGLLGVLTEYRDKKGNVTKWGRIAVIGAIVSTTLAVISQDLDFRRQAQEDRASAQRAERQAQSNAGLLEQIARAVDPLDFNRINLLGRAYWLCWRNLVGGRREIFFEFDGFKFD